MANKLWQGASSSQLNSLVEAYTVGNDYLLDQQLLGYDIQASKAHVCMLGTVDILNDEEVVKLVQALDSLQADWQAGVFVIQQDQEDGHTAIEQYLVDQLGDIGKKIHSGRSRNDQSLVMMRLYLKDQLHKMQELTATVGKAFAASAKKAGETPMPGYTHMQKAMPTTVALWLGSFADALVDTQILLKASLEFSDQNPLGSAAGFGVSLPINRDLTTKVLGFKKVQVNPLYCGMSRGLFELVAVQALNPVMVMAGKFAHDMLLFTTEEFGFFSLPDSFTSGSSIMPHKHNYDLFEVMRAKANIFGSYSQQLQAISSGLGSGYQRDLQLTKSIALEAFTVAQQTLELLCLVVPQLQIHKEKLADAITPEMLSVSEIDRLVEQGMPFRDAYHKIKNNLQSKP